MFDYVKAVPVYCNGHKWLSLSAESGTRPLGSSPDNPGKSCRHIKENVINARSGVYWIYPDPPRSAYKNPFLVKRYRTYDTDLYTCIAGMNRFTVK